MSTRASTVILCTAPWELGALSGACGAGVVHVRAMVPTVAQAQQPYPAQQPAPSPAQQPYPAPQQPYPPTAQPPPVSDAAAAATFTGQPQPAVRAALAVSRSRSPRRIRSRLPGYVQQPLAIPYAPPPVLQPVMPPASRYRSANEIAFLFGVGIAYGVGSGVWIDSVGHITDPGIAFIPPLVIGAAVPIGLYLWDQNAEFDRGVPSSIGTGAILGGLEGVAISRPCSGGSTGNGGPSSWSLPVWTTLTFLTATGGAIGGGAFGEWFQPDPRTLGFIASGAGWGALTGILFGSGVVAGDWKDGAAIWGFTGYNAGIIATGIVSTFYVPSWQTIKYM